MSDGQGQKVSGRTTIPVGQMAKDNLASIFPKLTTEQITALKEGTPVPPSPDWEGFNPANTKAVARVERDPSDTLRIAELQQQLDQATAALKVTVRRNQIFEGVLAAMGRTMPLVTCVLVFQNRDRLRRARKAVNQFVAQSYPNKQLVIVNASDLDITNVAHPAILEMKWPGGFGDIPTTGEMRNHAIENASGDLLFPFWDDDDIYDPDLLAFLVTGHKPGRAVTMTAQVRADIKNSVAYMHVEKDGIPNTLLCPKTAARFDSRTDGDDFAFWQRHWALKSEVVDTLAYPLNTLLTRVFDGHNVKTAEGFMGDRAMPEHYGKLELAESEGEHLKAVLATFGVKVEPKLPQEANQPAGV